VRRVASPCSASWEWMSDCPEATADSVKWTQATKNGSVPRLLPMFSFCESASGHCGCTQAPPLD